MRGVDDTMAKSVDVEGKMRKTAITYGLTTSSNVPGMRNCVLDIQDAEKTVLEARRLRRLAVYLARCGPLYRCWSFSHIKAEWKRAKRKREYRERRKHYDYVSRCPATGGKNTLLGDATHAIR